MTRIITLFLLLLCNNIIGQTLKEVEVNSKFNKEFASLNGTYNFNYIDKGLIKDVKITLSNDVLKIGNRTRLVTSPLYKLEGEDIYAFRLDNNCLAVFHVCEKKIVLIELLCHNSNRKIKYNTL